jgi:hypothetical protein
MPRSSAARHKSEGLPVGSAAASSNRRRVADGSDSKRRRKLSSMRSDSGITLGRAKPPARSASDKLRGNSNSAKGFPCVSASSCSRTRGSSGPTSAASRSRRASPSSSPSITSSGSLSRRGSDRRPAKTIPTASASSRLATNARVWTDAWSSHCSSSMRQTIGCSDAASDRRLNTARATRNRSGGGAARRPNATFTASRCGGGSRSAPPSNGLRT